MGDALKPLPAKHKFFSFLYDNIFLITVPALDEDNAKAKVERGVDCKIELVSKNLDLSRLSLQEIN